MRINKFVAQVTGLGRRKVDQLISEGRISVNDVAAKTGQSINPTDQVRLDEKLLEYNYRPATILLHKPVGYVCSRNGQGSQTIYDLIPKEYNHLKPVGRLDKDSSGLILLTNDGLLAQKLTHPSFKKKKVYEVGLDKSLTANDKLKAETGVPLDDGISRLQLAGSGKNWMVTMHEGRNRQIRRTFAALGYSVVRLHRTRFGDYALGNIKEGAILTTDE